MISRLFVRFCKRKWHSFGTVLCQFGTLAQAISAVFGGFRRTDFCTSEMKNAPKVTK